jgi:GNAT superfamily N-acetyltransferase
MSAYRTALAGQDTLLACWRALARTSFGPGTLVHTRHAVAALFPDFAYFNNAILTGGVESAEVAAASLADVYADSGIATWALWVPSNATAFDRPVDRVSAVGSLTRDVTTLVMQLELTAGHCTDNRVVKTSDSVLRRLVAEEAVPAHELRDRPADEAVTAWALSQDGRAVTSAYTCRHGSDCGIYAVGTLPPWRRRGLARALVGHILADAHSTGARTATLQSTPMGQSVYRALGFHAVGRYEEWLHSAVPQTSSKI